MKKAWLILVCGVAVAFSCGTSALADVEVDGDLTVTGAVRQVTSDRSYYTGNLGVGDTDPSYQMSVKGIAKFVETGNKNLPLEVRLFSSSWSKYPYFNLRKAHSDTIDDRVTTVNNEYLGAVYFYGANTNKQFAMAGGLAVRQDGSAGSSVPGRIELQTGEAGSSPLARMTIKGDGKIGIGTGTPSEILHVAGAARFDSGITYIQPLGDLSMGTFTNAP